MMPESGNLADVFLLTADRTPSQPAVFSGGRAWTYDELRGVSARISSALSRFVTAGAGSRVAILGGRDVPSYTSILATLSQGMTYVPLNPNFPFARNQRILESSEPEALIADRLSIAEVPHHLRATSSIRTLILPDLPFAPDWGKEFPRVRILSASDLSVTSESLSVKAMDPGSPAYLLFTSGTTGSPKGIPISHGNVLRYLRGISSVVESRPGDRFTQLFDLTFDLSVHDLFFCWWSGGCLYPIPSQSTLLAARLVRENSLTHWFSVPSVAGSLLREGLIDSGDLGSLRSTLFCGEALSFDLAERWLLQAPHSALVNLYGPTETTIAITSFHWRPEHHGRRGIMPIGTPFPGHDVLLLDETMRPAEGPQPGELCLSGPQVAKGYWKESRLSQERFIELPGFPLGKKWYRTGDLATMDPADGLVFHGRVDRQVKISGYRFELLEVESALAEASGTTEVAALPIADQGSGGIVAIAAFVAGSATTNEDILDRCRELLPPYAVPRYVRVLEQIPRNSNGKVDYSALIRMTDESA